MNARLVVFVVATLAVPASNLHSSEPDQITASQDRPRMPIYITPYYDSEPLQVSVGQISQELAALSAKAVPQLVQKLKANRDNLRVEVMYVAAIRLYDLGFKDEAVYWFYTAQYRARVFGSIVETVPVAAIGDASFELKQTYIAFHQLAGPYINGYAFGKLEKLESVLKAVVAEGQSLPDFAELYPEVKLADSQTWATKSLEVAGGVAKLIDFIKTKGDYIREQRKLNGVEGKY